MKKKVNPRSGSKRHGQLVGFFKVNRKVQVEQIFCSRHKCSIVLGILKIHLSGTDHEALMSIQREGKPLKLRFMYTTLVQRDVISPQGFQEVMSYSLCEYGSI